MEPKHSLIHKHNYVVISAIKSGDGWDSGGAFDRMHVTLLCLTCLKMRGLEQRVYFKEVK